MNDCKEILLEDIVEVSFYLASNVNCSVPFGVPGVNEMTATISGDPVLTISVTASDDADAVMETPSLKVSEKREAAGLLRSHDLQINVEQGFDAVKQAADGLSGADIAAVLKDYDGNRYIIHALPNSTLYSYEDGRGSSHTGKVKFTAQSLSHLVKLTANA